MSRDRCEVRPCREQADMTYTLDGRDYRVCSAEMARAPGELDAKLRERAKR